MTLREKFLLAIVVSWIALAVASTLTYLTNRHLIAQAEAMHAQSLTQTEICRAAQNKCDKVKAIISKQVRSGLRCS